MSKHIETKQGLKTLLKRYQDAGVTDETYSDRWISTIEGCIVGGFAMDETDYQNTPVSLRKLWKGLK